VQRKRTFVTNSKSSSQAGGKGCSEPREKWMSTCKYLTGESKVKGIKGTKLKNNEASASGECTRQEQPKNGGIRGLRLRKGRGESGWKKGGHGLGDGIERKHSESYWGMSEKRWSLNKNRAQVSNQMGWQFISVEAWKAGSFFSLLGLIKIRKFRMV